MDEKHSTGGSQDQGTFCNKKLEDFIDDSHQDKMLKVPTSETGNQSTLKGYQESKRMDTAGSTNELTRRHLGCKRSFNNSLTINGESYEEEESS